MLFFLLDGSRFSFYLMVSDRPGRKQSHEHAGEETFVVMWTSRRVLVARGPDGRPELGSEAPQASASEPRTWTLSPIEGF